MQNEKNLSSLPKLECAICLEDINKYYDTSVALVNINQQLLKLASTHMQGLKSLSSGRVVILRDGVCFPSYSGYLLSSTTHLALSLGHCRHTQANGST